MEKMGNGGGRVGRFLEWKRDFKFRDSAQEIKLITRLK